MYVKFTGTHAQDLPGGRVVSAEWTGEVDGDHPTVKALLEKGTLIPAQAPEHKASTKRLSSTKHNDDEEDNK